MIFHPTAVGLPSGQEATLEALPDALVVDDTNGNIWRDWSDEVNGDVPG